MALKKATLVIETELICRKNKKALIKLERKRNRAYAKIRTSQKGADKTVKATKKIVA